MKIQFYAKILWLICILDEQLILLIISETACKKIKKVRWIHKMREQLKKRAGRALTIVFALFLASCTAGFPDNQDNLVSLLFYRDLAGSLTFTVGGNVVGLTGNGLVISNRGKDSLAITTPGLFIFPDKIEEGLSYSVGIATQPSSPGQTCVVENGNGIIPTYDIDNVIINCSGGFTLGGIVQGLSGSGLILSNGTDRVSIDTDGSFVFPMGLADGESYNVTIESSPASQVCRVYNGSGSITGSSVSSIVVSCDDDFVPVFLDVNGLPAGASLGIRINGMTVDSISTNGISVYPDLIGRGTIYNASIQWESGGRCSLSPTSGAISNKTVIDVTCASPYSYKVRPGNHTAIDNTQGITVEFAEGMNAGSCSVTAGTMSSDSPVLVWSTNVYTNDTLTISPGVNWTAGSSDISITDCISYSGIAYSTIYLEYEIFNNLIYVSVDNPAASDSNSGLSPASPKATIQAGIAAHGTGCAASEDCAVLVASGIYTESLTMADGVSLYGGYTVDFSDRILDPNITVVNGVPSGPGVLGTPECTVFAGSAVRAVTRLDMFNIVAFSGDFVCGIFLNNSNMTVTNNVIYGSGGATDTVYGIYAIASKSIILRNLISGGLGKNIRGVEATGSGIKLAGNFIYGGNAGSIAGSSAYGVYLFDVQALSSIANNIIFAGMNADNSAGINLSWWGGSTDPVRVLNNTISSGSGIISSSGIYLADASVPLAEIRNNIVFTEQSAATNYCIFEDLYDLPSALANNDMFNCSSGLYYEDLSASSFTNMCGGVPGDVGCSSVMVSPGVYNNISQDPLFENDAGFDFRFKINGTSPCSATRGGESSYTNPVTNDYKWNTRSAPYSMGAYEWDGTCVP